MATHQSIEEFTNLVKSIIQEEATKLQQESKRPKTQEVTMEEFSSLVKKIIQEEVHAIMVAEMNEATFGSAPSGTTTGTVGTSGTSGGFGTKTSTGSNPGNDDPANNVMIQGTNLNINTGLAAASKETNFKKKADLINKISAQLSGMKGVVVKESELDGGFGQKISTRKPMHPELVGRITNLALYGLEDQEILDKVQADIDEKAVTTRWVLFIARVARMGLMGEVIDHLKAFQFKKKDAQPDKEDKKKETEPSKLPSK